MFIAALFTIAKLWKQPKCHTACEWIKKCGTCTQRNLIQPWRKMKSYHLR
jgi:hypothetical protein